MTLSCLAPYCTLPRQHIPGCVGDCRGCLPALAEPGEAFCATCTARLRRWLTEIPELFDEVVDPPNVRDERVWHLTDDPADRPRDPIAHRVPAGAVPGAARQPRVSGSPENALPVRYVEAGVGSMHVRPDYAHDQVGDPPPAVLLDSWARDWQTYLVHDLPPPTVDRLCAWFTHWLHEALRRHPAMADFFGEIRELHARLWPEAGRNDARPEPCDGVPCRRCDRLSLYRTTDGTGDVECHTADCQTVYRKDEYDRWVALVAASAKRVTTGTHAST